MTDGAALAAALAWAQGQPAAAWVVLRIPAGTHTLDRQLFIRRPRLVLRGDGSATTFLKVDKPLKNIKGVPKMKGGYGYYNQEAFIMFAGTNYLRGAPLATLTSRTERGARWVTVADAIALKVGTYYALVLSDTKAGDLSRHL